jgi:hypothetical protein
MAWSNNNLAHVHTWLSLKVLKQHNKRFENAGTVKMNQLIFWNPGDSSAMRATKARTIATQMDNMFRLFQGATYESGVTKIAAINAMTTILVDAICTMEDLGDAADAGYRFNGELSDVA